MHLDIFDRKIFFNRENSNKAVKLEVSGGGELQWTVALQEWWLSLENSGENFKKDLEDFANRLAELPGLETVNFSRWSLFRDDDALGYFCADEGLKQLGKCSGVEFVLPVTDDKDVIQRVKNTNLFKNTISRGSALNDAWVIQICSKDDAIFWDNSKNRSLLWNGYAQKLLLSPVSSGAVEFKAFAEALATKATDAQYVDFNRLACRIGNKKIGFIRKKAFWKAMNAKSVDLKSLIFICPPANSELWGGVFDVIKNGVQSFGWDVAESDEESRFLVKAPKNPDKNPGDLDNDNPNGGADGGMGG